MIEMNSKAQLADFVAQLYERLTEEGFQGDVTMFTEAETKLSIWEGFFVLDYHEEMLPVFGEEQIEEILLAFRAHRGATRKRTKNPPNISYEVAEESARRELPEHVHRFFIHPVDLATQLDLFTDDDPTAYQSSAWKVWCVYLPDRSDLPSTELFYIAMPKAMSHIIR
jgi:hypothetical protein